MKVLLVDDEFQITEALREYLVLKGFNVQTTRNEKEAVSVLDVQSNSFDPLDEIVDDLSKSSIQPPFSFSSG